MEQIFLGSLQMLRAGGTVGLLELQKNPFIILSIQIVLANVDRYIQMLYFSKTLLSKYQLNLQSKTSVSPSGTVIIH